MVVLINNMRGQVDLKLESKLTQQSVRSPVVERLSFEDVQEKRFVPSISLMLQQPFGHMGANWHQRRELQEQQQEAEGVVLKVEHESPRATYLSRSAFKLTRASPYSQRNVASGVKRNIKEVRVRLDFSSKGADKRDAQLSTAETRCSVDERYISKRFVLSKINLTDMKEEIEKINKVGAWLTQLRNRRDASIERVLAKELASLVQEPGMMVASGGDGADRKVKCNCRNSKCPISVIHIFHFENTVKCVDYVWDNYSLWNARVASGDPTWRHPGDAGRCAA